MGTQISESVGNAYENVLQNYSSTSAEEKDKQAALLFSDGYAVKIYAGRIYGHKLL